MKGLMDIWASPKQDINRTNRISNFNGASKGQKGQPSYLIHYGTFIGHIGHFEGF
jgi:hypothetical protein